MKGLSLTVVLLFAGLLSNSSGASSFPKVQNTAQGSGDLMEASDLSNSAVKLYNEGKYNQALKPAKRALEIREGMLPADDKEVVSALDTLATIHLALRNFKEAEGLFIRLLAAQEKAGVENLGLANTLEALAWLRNAKGDVNQAQADYKRSLAIKEKAVGPESKEVAQTLFKLAEIYYFQGALEKAQPLYQRLVAYDEETEVDSNLTVKDALLRYACLMRKMNKADQAGALERRALGTPPPIGQVGNQPPPRGGVLNGKAFSLGKPNYPPEARKEGASGTVAVQLTISEQGKVIYACAISGHPLLWAVSERAAYDSKFAPTRLEGKPVKVTGIITYNFVR